MDFRFPPRPAAKRPPKTPRDTPGAAEAAAPPPAPKARRRAGGSESAAVAAGSAGGSGAQRAIEHFFSPRPTLSAEDGNDPAEEEYSQPL